MNKVFITGGTGFIGANFVHKLLERGDDVHLLVREGANFERIASVKGRISLYGADLNEEHQVSALVERIKPDVVLHFATYGAYPGRQTDAKAMVETNVLGTVNLVNACAKIGVKCFLNTGSSSEYGEKDHPMSENDLLEPNSLYGATKAAGTLYCRVAAEKMGLPIATMRLFSPYGYFEAEGRLMPNIVRAALKEEPFKAPSPTLVRDFVFIEDVINAYLKAIERADNIKGRIFNIASGEQHSIAEVVAAVEKVTGKKLQITYGEVAARQREPKMWMADISLAKELLGWSPEHSLEGGLQKYIAWYRNQ